MSMTREPVLGQWVRNHRVTWEVMPHRDNTGRRGYDLVLYARHPPLRDGDPGCPECRRIYEGLARLARLSLPQRTDSRISMAPFDAAFHMRRETDWAPEILLSLEITPRGGDDAVALLSVEDIEDALSAVGAQPGRWREPP
jgi:hypothetical protein